MGVEVSWWALGVVLAVVGPLVTRVVAKRATDRALERARQMLARANAALLGIDEPGVNPPAPAICCSDALPGTPTASKEEESRSER